MNLIKVPFAALNLNKNLGTKHAPEQIVQNLKRFSFTEDHLLPNFQIKEIPVNQNNVQESFQTIIQKAKEFFQQSEQNFFLGGDHSITYPLVKAFAQTFQNPQTLNQLPNRPPPPSPGLVIFDAHPDCQSDFNPPTHEDLLLALINQNIIKKENIILVGIRSWSKEEYHFLKQHQIKYFSMKEITQEGLYESSEALMSIAKNFSHLYLSIDIDVLDPAFAPGTGYPEPGGLTTRELLYFLQRLKKLKNFKAADLVEINPEKDQNTALVGAKIISELF